MTCNEIIIWQPMKEWKKPAIHRPRGSSSFSRPDRAGGGDGRKRSSAFFWARLEVLLAAVELFCMIPTDGCFKNEGTIKQAGNW